MKLHFYGTGASEGFPAMFCDCEYCVKARSLGKENIRTRTSVGLDEHVLIDFSADSYMHTIYGGLDMRKIRHILLTHSHSDHFYPVDLLTILEPMAWRKSADPLQLYGPKDCMKKMSLCHGYTDEAKKRLPLYALPPFENVKIESYTVKPLLTCHDPHEDCYIYIIKNHGKTLLYAHDSHRFPPKTWQAILRERYDCCVLDCTSVTTPNVFANHMSFEDDLEIRQRLIASGAADESTVFIANHFAHTYNPLHQRIFPLFAQHGFIAAYDGMEITF